MCLLIVVLRLYNIVMQCRQIKMIFGELQLYMNFYPRHQVALLAWISLILSRHPSQSSIALPDCFQCLHRADVCKTLLDGHHWCAYMLESMRERRI